MNIYPTLRTMYLALLEEGRACEACTWKKNCQVFGGSRCPRCETTSAAINLLDIPTCRSICSQLGVI